MGSFSAQVRNAWLDALARGEAYANAQIWVKLHLGDPGAAGTLLPAAETTRQLGAFAVAAAGGEISNTAALTWTNVAASETYSHVSLWSGETSGLFLGSDQLPAPVAVVAGGSFAIAIGDLDLTVA
jgi:hypothetical protein